MQAAEKIDEKFFGHTSWSPFLKLIRHMDNTSVHVIWNLAEFSDLTSLYCLPCSEIYLSESVFVIDLSAGVNYSVYV